MHLYAPERPYTGGNAGFPALLIDGSAVPQITVMPQPDGKMLLSCMLHNYSTGEGYNYTYHYVEVDAHALPEFFTNYALDPELTIKTVFDWTPQSVKPMRTKPAPQRRAAADAADYVNSLI